MTKDTFVNFASSNQAKLINVFTKKGYERADAEDYVSRWVLWGLEKEWRDNETHGFHEAVNRIRSFIRDDREKLSTIHEVALGFDKDDTDDTEVCDYDFSHLFTETNERSADEFDSLAASLIGDEETSQFTQEVKDRLEVLTSRQQDIAYLAEQGMNQYEIALHLGISQPAVSKAMTGAVERVHEAWTEQRGTQRPDLLVSWRELQTLEDMRRAAFVGIKPNINFACEWFDEYEATPAPSERRIEEQPEGINILGNMMRAYDACASAGAFVKAARLARHIGIEFIYPYDQKRPARTVDEMLWVLANLTKRETRVFRGQIETVDVLRHSHYGNVNI